MTGRQAYGGHLDPQVVLDGLRWGPHPPGDSACAPFGQTSLANVRRWLRVSRVPRDGDKARFTDLLRLLFGADRSVHFLLHGPPGADPAFLIGFEDDGMASWARSIAAPSLIFEDEAAPDVTSMAGHAGGLTYRLAPEGLDIDEDAPPGGLIDRLLRFPHRGWMVSLEAVPLGLRTLEDLIASIDRGDTELALAADRTVRVSETDTIRIESPEVEAARDWLAVMRRYASLAREDGGWEVAIYVGGDDPSLLDMLKGAVTGALVGSAAGHWIPQRLTPDARGGERPSSLLLTSDLSQLLRLPTHTVPGLHTTGGLPEARASRQGTHPIDIGTWLGTDQRFVVDVEDLAGHVLVAGTTGSGKTSTVTRILWQLWNRHGIPFLVVDPVKSGYERVGHAVNGGIRFLRGADLRSNILEPEPGFDPRTHLEFVANAFKGSFSMPPPIPYVVSQLFELLADRAGWDPLPTLHDLRDLVDDFVSSLGYDAEVTANIRAALQTRLGSLVAGSRAERHASPDNRHLVGLLEVPTVVSLTDIGDDEERSFVMAMLGLRVAEAARVRGSSGEVQHVLVLEEAHRILPAVSVHAADPERGDAVAMTSRFFAQLLAEMRSFGESVIVVDQSPGALSSAVLKNTNLKIGMRVSEASDQEALGGSLGLLADEVEVLGRLMRGEAIVSTRTVPEPQTVAVDVEMPLGTTVLRQPAAGGEDVRACCRGTEIKAHHASERHGADAEAVMVRWLVAMRLDRTEASATAKATRDGLESLVERYPEAADRCLAWVGLRRALGAYARVGHLAPGTMAELLDEAVGAFWAGRRPQLDGLRDGGRNRPFPGCSACARPCLFRVFADREGLFSAGDLAIALRRQSFRYWPTWTQDWVQVAREALEPWFGEAAGDAVTCAVVHSLTRLEAPWRFYRQVLRFD